MSCDLSFATAPCLVFAGPGEAGFCATMCILQGSSRRSEMATLAGPGFQPGKRIPPGFAGSNRGAAAQFSSFAVTRNVLLSSFSTLTEMGRLPTEKWCCNFDTPSNAD